MLCVASYEKGYDFLTECKRLGCRVILLAAEKTASGKWPHDSIDEFITLPKMDRNEVTRVVSDLARTRQIDLIVPLDDYDVETAAALREHLRVPGMGDTTARYFRDKLAMRVQARDKGILVPPFVHALNHDQISEFIANNPPPWLLKPRSEAAAMGIRKIDREEDLWPALDSLGDRQSYYVLEKYVPGDVFHVDALVFDRQVVFSEVHQYNTPPYNVAHEGGVFATRTIRNNTARLLRQLTIELLAALGIVRGAVHAEFIQGREDKRLYFLETASRVGGAYIANLVEAATGVNMWAEWARIEVAGSEARYDPPLPRQDYGGLIISLARQEVPDTSAYNDPEIVWRLDHHHHVGLLVCSEDPQRVIQLLDDYTRRFFDDFFATQPARDKPTS